MCQKCLMPMDAHCLMCEPVPLCPVVVNGAFKTPCQRVGPKGVPQ